MDRSKTQEILYQTGGWILFLIGTILFIAAGLRNGDLISLAGSLAFLIGCALFMVPLSRQIKELNRERRPMRPRPKIGCVKRFMSTPQMRLGLRRRPTSKNPRVQPTSSARLAMARKI